MLTKTILNVPFKEKDAAKQLGALWDPKQKAWYVPPGKDTKQFASWLPKDSEKPKLTINQIGLIRTITPCWSCKGFCTVHGLYAKEITVLKQEKKLSKKKQKAIDSIKAEVPENLKFYDNLKHTGFFVLIDINQIPDALSDFLIIRCPNYRKGKPNAAGEKLYRNHCDHCSIGISDHKLHKKNKAFNPQKLAHLKTMQFIDLMFFDELELQADFIDYTSHNLFLESIEFADYLTDFI